MNFYVSTFHKIFTFISYFPIACVQNIPLSLWMSNLYSTNHKKLNIYVYLCIISTYVIYL